MDEQVVESLSAEQQRALVLLALGKSIPAVADDVKVHRSTVYRWITADAHFRAAYNAWQLEQRESFRAKLLKCAEIAVDRVATMVDYDHKFAWKVARELGMVGTPRPLYVDPAQVEREIELERLEEENLLQKRRQESSSSPPVSAVPEAASPAPAPSGSTAMQPDSSQAEEPDPQATEEHCLEQERAEELRKKRGWYMDGNRKVFIDINGAPILNAVARL